MSVDVKRSKSQLSKIIQSGRFLGGIISDLGKFDKSLGKEALTKIVVSFANVLPEVVSNIASHGASNVINNFERRISGKRAVGARKGFTLFISNKNMDDVIKIRVTRKIRFPHTSTPPPQPPLTPTPTHLTRGEGINKFQQFCQRRGEMKNFFWSGASWEKGGQFLEGDSGFLEIAIINFTS